MPWHIDNENWFQWQQLLNWSRETFCELLGKIKLHSTFRRNPIPGCDRIINGIKLSFKLEAKVSLTIWFTQKLLSIPRGILSTLFQDFLVKCMTLLHTRPACLILNTIGFFADEFLGDKAYPLSFHLITPYKNRCSRRDPDCMAHKARGILRQAGDWRTCCDWECLWSAEKRCPISKK